MLKIGEFSKLSRVSIRMLRHYDDIGLLKPAEIDDFTGYRYYREEQLFAIGRITSLKDMGFALADIIKILDSYDDKEKMDAFLSERQKELSKLSQETEYKLIYTVPLPGHEDKVPGAFLLNVKPVHILLVSSLAAIPWFLWLAYREKKRFLALCVGAFVTGVVLVFSADFIFNDVLQDHQRKRIEVPNR